MTPRADTHSRVERERHSRVVGTCWSIVFVSEENLLRMLPRGVVSNSLRAQRTAADQTAFSLLTVSIYTPP